MALDLTGIQNENEFYTTYCLREVLVGPVQHVVKRRAEGFSVEPEPKHVAVWGFQAVVHGREMGILA